MDLILWRHAEAQEWLEGCDDMARSLTSRGEKQAARMANWLDRQLPEGTRIFVSPARRCEQTAQALGRKYKLREELAPAASADQLLALVQWPLAKGTVLVVGHQPTLGQTIAQLLGLSAPECAVKKGAVWWLRNRQREALSQTVVVAVQSPEVI
ncbi:phosphohistidine phosphatase, SixA [Rhodoferax ferrireducens T118]|uniref:Phosphohistidine phosphatase, SixA n=1 Tax=Albidiferax ferrireducens (strain ATCC BAA-621 / DSM 15236 / T118) TaxID=338969 RepID=Q21WW0_ALBFT|nr:phosphohistidine phosphatase SixA [Rhodoferax ferrireducens]ABD69743.1 phosphohistidine phosphatase, SixA [Rhodoferax ferrireducens T118]WPC68866.1 phosphohistidine phosphatase SixA [Rhodoferax ferrireducens]